jgi:hypothetical protein
VNFSITDAEIFISGATVDGVSSTLFSQSRLIESATMFSDPAIWLIEKSNSDSAMNHRTIIGFEASLM